MNYNDKVKQVKARYKIGTEFMDKIPNIMEQFEGQSFDEFYSIIDKDYKGIRKFLLLSYMWLGVADSLEEEKYISARMKSVFDDYLCLNISDKDIDETINQIVNA
jgi:hypothetical protein